MKARGPPTKMALERVRKLGQGNFGVAVLARLDGMHDTEPSVLAVCERCLAGRWHVQRVFFQNVVFRVTPSQPRSWPAWSCVCGGRWLLVPWDDASDKSIAIKTTRTLYGRIHGALQSPTRHLA